jgi:hypothetical protein
MRTDFRPAVLLRFPRGFYFVLFIFILLSTFIFSVLLIGQYFYGINRCIHFSCYHLGLYLQISLFTSRSLVKTRRMNNITFSAC